VSRRILVPLRWGDLDAQGHINNAVFADYMQEARADYLTGTPAEHLLTDGMVIVKQQIEYRAPAVYSPEPLAVDTWPYAIGGAKFNFAYEMRQGDVLVAEGRALLCPYDTLAIKPRGLTPEERAFLQSQAEPAEPFRRLVWRPMNARARVAPIRVRWSDMDAYGHVNNVLFLNYAMEGRIAFTAGAVQSMTDSVDSGDLWLVARQDVEYLTPIQFRPEPYMVRTGVSHLGTTSLTFCSEISDPDKHTRFGKATTVAVFADAQGRPKPIIPQWREALEPYLLG